MIIELSLTILSIYVRNKKLPKSITKIDTSNKI